MEEKFDALDDFVKQDFERRLAGDLPKAFDQAIIDYKAQLVAEPVKVATRKASQMALEVVNAAVPETIGGSADLTGSNLTKLRRQPRSLPMIFRVVTFITAFVNLRCVQR